MFKGGFRWGGIGSLWCMEETPGKIRVWKTLEKFQFGFGWERRAWSASRFCWSILPNVVLFLLEHLCKCCTFYAGISVQMLYFFCWNIRPNVVLFLLKYPSKCCTFSAEISVQMLYFFCWNIRRMYFSWWNIRPNVVLLIRKNLILFTQNQIFPNNKFTLFFLNQVKSEFFFNYNLFDWFGTKWNSIPLNRRRLRNPCQLRYFQWKFVYQNNND